MALPLLALGAVGLTGLTLGKKFFGSTGSESQKAPALQTQPTVYQLFLWASMGIALYWGAKKAGIF